MIKYYHELILLLSEQICLILPIFLSLSFQHCCDRQLPRVTGRLHTFPRHRSAFPWGFRFREVREVHFESCVRKARQNRRAMTIVGAVWGHPDGDQNLAKMLGDLMWLDGGQHKHENLDLYWTQKWPNLLVFAVPGAEGGQGWPRACRMARKPKCWRAGRGAWVDAGEKSHWRWAHRQQLPGILTEWQEVQKKSLHHAGWLKLTQIRTKMAHRFDLAAPNEI